MRYKIRELKLGEVLDQAVNLTKDHFGVLLGITALLLVPYELISGLIVLSMIPKLPPNPTQAQALAVISTTFGLIIPILLVRVYVVTPITNAAVIHAIANAYLEKPISVGDSFKRALPRILPLIGTWVLVGLLVFVGIVLCVVPGILFAFWYALATQVVVLESAWGVEAMTRSKQLMTGNIGTFFVLGILLGAISFGITSVVGLIPEMHVRVLVSSIAVAVATIFGSAVVVVFYFSCRCKHEQFDLALLAQSVGAKTPDDAGDAMQWE
jgi:uncharacterized membrane protein